ncbi:MAG: formylmethanofuran dehydrogenase [Gammaproteobacteria bacterium]|nr:formylmethanofuran dehydrogenase [Gammaproteobacteria bacterium]
MPVATTITFKNVVCPFCSLLCDDLAVSLKDGRLKAGHGACPLARHGLEYTGTALSPHVDAKPVPYVDALGRAAQILRSARQPLVGGMGTDVRGCQAAVALAERCGAAVDHMHSDAALCNTFVLQSRGGMLTTLTELRNRADLIVFVGTDALATHPRFYERCVWPSSALITSRLKSRQIIYIGDKLKTRHGTGRGRRGAQLVACNRHEIADILGALRMLHRGRNPATTGIITRARLAQLNEVVRRLRAARYGVLVWSAAELDPTNRELVIQAISELVVALNETTRFAGLALGGADGGTSSANVCAWQTGFPGRVNFTAGKPEFDPELYRGRTMLQSGMADALLWISSFGTDAKLPVTQVPTIALTRPSQRVARSAKVYIPVGTPGVDHDGSLFRLDGVVSLPLRGLRTPQMPSVAHVLTQLRERL